MHDWGTSSQQDLQVVLLHLRNMSSIRKYLTTNAAHTIVHAFISSRLDYYNALLYGLPKYLVDSLQHVQNSAARVVTFTRTFDHITPVLIDLHWLPVYYRVIFKLLLHTFKALNGMAHCFFPIVPLATLFALLQINFLLTLELSLPLLVFGPFHSLLRDIRTGYIGGTAITIGKTPVPVCSSKLSPVGRG